MRIAPPGFTPTKSACGVDIVDPFNLQTLLKTIPPYWEAGKQQFYKRMGDPTTVEGCKLLDAASPLYKVDAIVRPQLIGQGAKVRYGAQFVPGLETGLQAHRASAKPC